MYFIFLSAGLLFNALGDSIPQQYPYLIKPTSVNFDLKQYELVLPKKYKDSVLASFATDCPFCHYKDSMPSLIKFKNSFHFIDLNGDHLPDLIYEGRTGSEGMMVEFYLNKKKGFKLLFTDYEKLLDLKFQNGKLSSAVIWNYGCCDATVEFERHFTVDTSSWKFNLLTQRAILTGMDVFDKFAARPDGFFDQPIKFRINNPEYALRYSPAISDTVPSEIAEGKKEDKGNIIALYKAGNEGLAWAYKTDATGRVWWLVEMEAMVYLEFSKFWDYDYNFTHYYGWMSSRFLQKLP